MPPRRRVRRLGDIALVRVAELVGQRILEFARRCDPDELDRNVALVKSNICVCVPPAMYDDFAVHVLKTMSRVVDSGEISKAFLYKSMASPLMTITDQLSTVKRFPEVSNQLVILAYMNLHKLKNLRNLEIDLDHILELDTVCRSFYPKSSIIGGKLHWLGKCDLRFMKKLVCPEYLCDEYTFSLLEKNSRLEALTVYNSCDCREIPTTVSIDLGIFSGLRELDIHELGDEFDSVLEDVLSRNRHLEKLVLDSELEVFSKSDVIYPALKHLHVRHETTNSGILSTVATRFPNLASLELYLAEGFDPSIFTAFPHLSSLSIRVYTFPLNDLRALLRDIGRNIVSLDLPYGEPISQSDLFIICKHCRNCENLDFLWDSRKDVDPLIMPSFPKLKRLDIEVTYQAIRAMHNQDPVGELPLDFTEMPSLEYLRYWNFDVSQTRLELMVLDSKNFPRLTQIVLPSGSAQEKVKHIQRLIKEHNLDVTFAATDL